MRNLSEARRFIADSSSMLVLTGAGISLASGIATFRGSKDSLWRKRELMRYAFAETLAQDPQGTWRMHEQARQAIVACKPNAAHQALHALAAQREVLLFTQNVDGLHQAMGSTVKELHGNIRRIRCPDCNQVTAHHELEVCPQACPACKGMRRHDVVLFGENVEHHDELVHAFSRADCVLLAGTSGLVTDTQSIAREARKRGKKVIEVNPALLTPATLWTHVSLRGKAEEVLPELVT